MANTRRMNRLEELGRVDAEKAYTRKGKKNLKAEKSRIVGELKRKKGGSTKRSMGPAGASTVSADGKRMKLRKKARGAMAELTRLLGAAKKRKPSGRLTSDDIKRVKIKKQPTGRSAAAKKAAMKGAKTKAGTFMGKLKTGKPSPHTNRDESYLGWIGRRKKLMEYLPRQKRTPAKSKPLRGGGVAKRGMGRAK